MPLTSPSLGRSALDRLTELESRYDGPFPERERRVLRHGSTLTSEIAEVRAEITFFREMAARARRSGKAWRRRGNAEMSARAVIDCRIYLAGWRSRRRRINDLERLGTVYDIASAVAPEVGNE